jgi:hypothetical protein
MAQLIKVNDGVLIVESSDPTNYATMLVLKGKNNNGTLFLKGSADVDQTNATVYLGASTTNGNSVSINITGTGPNGTIDIGSILKIGQDSGQPGQVLTSNGPGTIQTWQNNAGTSGYSGFSGYSGSFGNSESAVFTGNSTTLALILTNTAEVVSILPIAAADTIHYDVTLQSVVYYTENSLNNWTLNIRAAFGVTLDSVLKVGQSITLVFAATQGYTAYYPIGFQIDGKSIEPKWQGGVTPTSGNINSIDVYSYTIVKTGVEKFVVLANQTKYA